MTRGSAWLVVAVGVAVAAPAAGQGLGDASKKEKQRRETSSDPVRSYSDDDLEELGPVGDEADGQEPAAAVATPRSGSTGRPERRRTPDRRDDEDRWRALVARARGRVEEERARYEHAASLTLVPGYALVDEDNRIVASSVEELQANTARAKARLEAAEKALADLLETARREGVPPGWLR